MSEEVTPNISRELVAPGIYRYTSTKPRIGWTKDKRSGKWTCFGIDLMIPLGVRDANGRQKRKRHRQKPIETKDAAEKILARLKLAEQEQLYDVVLSARGSVTLEELFDKVIPTLESANERNRALRVKQHFLEILPKYYLVTEVDEADTFKYCEKRRKEGARPGTQLREITTFSAILHKAPLFFKKELKNFKCPKIFRPDDSGYARERVWTAEEREKLLKYLLSTEKYYLTGKRGLHRETQANYVARRRTGLIIYLALMTSLRHGDVCKVKKSWWDKKADMLKVKHGKTENFTVYTPVPETIREILTEAERLLPDSEYFFSAQGKIHNNAYGILKRVCGKDILDLPYGKDMIDGFVIHDARKTTITTLQQNQVDSRTTQSVSGHKRPQMVNYYTVAGTDARQRAAEIIERELSLNGKNGKGRITVHELYELVRTGAITEEEFAEKLKSVR